MSTPVYPAPYPGPTPTRSDALGVTALILGILALIFCWVSFLGLALAVLALIFGIVGIGKSHRGMSIAGIAPTTETPPVPSVGDFSIGLSTTSKQCFGSAGCDLVVQPSFSYHGKHRQPG